MSPVSRSLENARKLERLSTMSYSQTREPSGSSSTARCVTKAGQPPKLKPKAKHSFIVHIWVGISKRGATPVLIFTGIMRKEFYVSEIMQNILVPFTQRAFPDGYRFQQDKDTKHTTKFDCQQRKDKISRRLSLIKFNAFS